MSGRDVMPAAKQPFVRPLELACAVAGGPLAWLSQINVTYPLLATPCFPGPVRNLSFPPNSQWAFVLAVIAYLALLGLALISALLARRLYKRLSGSGHSSGDNFEGSGVSRVRFLAFCGMLLATGFSALILLNGVALLMVPPCAI